MAIGKKLETLLQLRGKKPGTLATETGINKNTIYAIIKRDNEKVNMGTLTTIAEALGVSVDYFFEKDLDVNQNKRPVQMDEPEAESEEFVRLFTSLDAENRKRILDLMRALASSQA